MDQNMFIKDVILLVVIVAAYGNVRQCPDYQVHFEKILGYRPTLPSSVYDIKILHKSYQLIPTIINLHCMELCKNDQHCDSYILNFNKSECYGFGSDERMVENLNFRSFNDNKLVEDLEAVYFVKTCLSSKYAC